MYAEAGILLPYLQSFPHEFQHFVPKTGAWGNLVQPSTILQYDLGGGNLFKAPETILEEPVVGFDAMTSAISMISSDEDVISAETINVADIESIQSKQLLNEVFYGEKSQRSLVLTSSAFEYDHGGGDLFKAPETIIEEPAPGFGTMTAAIPMISSGEDVISTQTIKVADIESIEREHLLNEVFYECKKDLLEKSAMNGSFSEVSDVKIPVMPIKDSTTERHRLVVAGPVQKSISSESLSSMEWIGRAPVRPRFLDFQAMDLGAAIGMRRAFSEGDIQTLGNGNRNPVHSHLERMLAIGNYPIEDRRQKLSRYRKKKTRRNFDRKIKYACRKALADNQPRCRGRFAKSGEADLLNSLK
ncbi:uncharacterized protein LOC131245169 [Magnolia sinica]|uniref:uncharacterized protein LOC131245169 n=1 Tax=Magnolia sinica TaxID=86752 RepID=UPI00265AC329|nr:uncharacterized protein LOC131245169 [Magnolia sinica]